MALLLSVRDLSIWVLPDVIPEGDKFAKLVVEVASEKVCSVAGHHEWTVSGATAAPPRARHIAAALAARSWKNPDSVQTPGTLGPIGGDRTVEELAKFLHLTEAEEAELYKLGGLGSGGVSGGLWVQPVTSSSASAAASADVFIPDSSGSDWWIPMGGNPDDPPAFG